MNYSYRSCDAACQHCTLEVDSDKTFPTVLSSLQHHTSTYTHEHTHTAVPRQFLSVKLHLRLTRTNERTDERTDARNPIWCILAALKCDIRKHFFMIFLIIN